MDPQVMACVAIGGAVLILAGVVALLALVRKLQSDAAGWAARAGAAELRESQAAGERLTRDLAESRRDLAAVLERERTRAAGAAQDLARAQDLAAARAGAGGDDRALGDRVLRLLGAGADPAASTTLPHDAAGDTGAAPPVA